MKRNYSYIGVSFIILVFGTWVVPKIMNHFSSSEFATLGKVPSFSFTNQDGKIITNKTFYNKVYVVDFFFTTCPTICPVMTENMVTIQNEFIGNPNFGIASISISPDYDTPEVLKAYAKNHGATLKNWHFLTGNKEDTYKLSMNGFKLYAGQNNEAPGGFEHSGLFALIDKEGNIRCRYDDLGNPIGYYDGLDLEQIQLLKEDIEKLIKS